MPFSGRTAGQHLAALVREFHEHLGLMEGRRRSESVDRLELFGQVNFECAYPPQNHPNS
jgi:hypothetical protein